LTTIPRPPSSNIDGEIDSDRDALARFLVAAEPSVEAEVHARR